MNRGGSENAEEKEGRPARPDGGEAPGGASLWRQFTGREATPLVQFIKYGIAGGAATGTNIVVFFLLAWLAFPALTEGDFMVRLFGLPASDVTSAIRARNAMIDNALAFLVANMVAYLLNILWVFERGRHHVVVEILLFYLVSGIAAGLGTVLMGGLIAWFGLQTTIAFGANIITAVLINYAVRKFFIFKG